MIFGSGSPAGTQDRATVKEWRGDDCVLSQFCAIAEEWRTAEWKIFDKLEESRADEAAAQTLH
jgi:hypothetical protein